LDKIFVEEAVSELHTLQDMIRWTVSRFNAANLFYGHGTDNAWDEAVQLILPTLYLPIDERIDGHTVRNRSQAIESIVRSVVSPSVSCAVILAGGNKLKHPKTGKLIPSSMLPIQGVPLVVQSLKQLQRYGFSKVVVCADAEAIKMIKTEVEKSDWEGLEIVYSNESKRLGTGGALKQASKLIPKGPFLLLHGDVISDINLNEFVGFYNEEGKPAAVAVKPRPGRLSYGQIFMEGSNVIDFREPKKAPVISMTNTGVYIFDHSVLDRLPKKEVFKIEETLIPELVKEAELSGYMFQGIWFDVSDQDDYQEANQRWQV